MKINRIMKFLQINLMHYLNIIVSLIWNISQIKAYSRKRNIFRIIIMIRILRILVRNVKILDAISKEFQEKEDMEEYIKLNLTK